LIAPDIHLGLKWEKDFHPADMGGRFSANTKIDRKTVYEKI